MGTALTEAQVQALLKHTRQVYLCFDADAAGQGAMLRALALARRLDVTIHVIRVPDGLDPADWVRAGHDAADFARLADAALTLLQFHVRSILSAHDLAKPDDRTRALALLQGALAEAASPIERDEEVRYIADSLRLSPESVRHLLSGLAAGGRQGRVAQGHEQRVPSATAAVSRRLLSAERTLEARFLAACVAVPADGAKCVAAVDETYFADPDMRRAYQAVRRRLGRLGAAAAGESESQEEATADEEAGQAADGMAEVMVRASGERFDAQVLLDLFLRLQHAQAVRRHAELRRAMRNASTRPQELKLEKAAADAQREVHRLARLISALPVEESVGTSREEKGRE